MIRKQSGFTLVELLVTIVVFLFVIIAAGNIFSGLVGQFKQQSKIAESNIEGMVGLEMLRFDIEQAGFGLPWTMNGVTYSEVDASNATGAAYNDSPGNPPRAIITDNNLAASTGVLNNSDYLVIKATNVATNAAASKWTYLRNTDGVTDDPEHWNSASEDLANGDRVIVIMPTALGKQRVLANSSGTFWTSFYSSEGSWNTDFLPITNTNNIVYGISASGTPRMPFNRADYYVKRPSSNMPQRCAPGTGVLYKGVVNAGGNYDELPLLDCVADMQIVTMLDVSETGTESATSHSESLDGMSAEETRNQVREIRIYILAQEGQKDTTYRYPTSTFPISDPDVGSLDFDLSAAIGPTYANYRWKLYTLVATPYNLR